MPRCPEQQVSAVSGQPSSVATQLQQPTPAVLQQPGTHDATVIIDDGYLKCTLCNKYVTEDHLESRQHKRLLAAQEKEKEEDRSLGDDFRDADRQPAQQPEMTTWGYTCARAEWDEWHAWNVNETVDTYG